jgi:hypothetical protein
MTQSKTGTTAQMASIEPKPLMKDGKAQITVNTTTHINSKQVKEDGYSPESIILAIVILLTSLFGGLTWLVYVILGGKPPR